MLRHQRKTKSLKIHRYCATLPFTMAEGNSPHLTFLNGLAWNLSPAWATHDTGNSSWGKNETVYENHHKQKNKPKYRILLPNSLNLFKPTCRGRKNTTGLQHQTLKTLRIKYGSKKSCCSRSQDGGVLRLGGRWPHMSPVWSSVSAICDSSQLSIQWMFQSLNACFVSWKTVVLTYKRHKNQINTLLSNTIYNRGR